MNKIKKVILSMNKDSKSKTYNDLEVITVVRESSLDVYNKADNLKEKYLMIAKELIEQYKDEVVGLDSQAAIDKIWKELKVITYSKEELIRTVKFYKNENNELVRYVVIYDNHKEEHKLEDFYDEDEFINSFESYGDELEKTYNIHDLETMKNIGLLKMFKHKKDIEHIEKDNKVKKLRINHKVLYSTLAGAIIIAGIWGGSKLIAKKNNSKETNTKKQEPVIEFITSTPTPTVYEEALEFDDFFEDMYYEEEPEVTITPTPTKKPKEIELITGNKVKFDHEQAQDNRIMVKVLEGDNYYLDGVDVDLSNENLFENLRNVNMSNIGNYIQSGEEFSDPGAYIYFENKFNTNLRDKAFVKYFSMLGNQIIKNAYLNKNMSKENGVRYYVEQSNIAVKQFIENNQPIIAYINGEKQEIRYSDLSLEAKSVVLQIAIANNCPTFEDTFSYNGQEITQNDISNIILEKWSELDYSYSK